MHITKTSDRNNNPLIVLSRYGGSTTENGARKSLSVRIGAFPADALPEFNTSQEDNDPQRIPYEIYRSTTIDEHVQIIDYIKAHRFAELSTEVDSAVAKLKTIISISRYGAITGSDAEKLDSACKTMLKVLRKERPKTNASSAAGVGEAAPVGSSTPPASDSQLEV